MSAFRLSREIANPFSISKNTFDNKPLRSVTILGFLTKKILTFYIAIIIMHLGYYKDKRWKMNDRVTYRHRRQIVRLFKLCEPMRLYHGWKSLSCCCVEQLSWNRNEPYRPSGRVPARQERAKWFGLHHALQV